MIDVHAHIGLDEYKTWKNKLPKGQPAEDLVKKMLESNIEKAVVFSFPFTSYFDLKTVYDLNMRPSGKMKFAYEQENKYVLESAEKHACLIPFLSICLGEHSNYEWVEEIVKTNKKIRGFKLHSRSSRSAIKQLAGSKFMKLAQEYELSFMIHTDSENINLGHLNFNYMRFSDPMQLIELSDKHPDVKLAGAHLGWVSKRFLDEVKRRENVFVDTSPFLVICNLNWRAKDALALDYKNPAQALSSLCEEYGDSIIWGTDDPYGVYVSKTLKDEKGVLDAIDIKTAEMIGEKNTKRYLYGRL